MSNLFSRGSLMPDWIRRRSSTTSAVPCSPKRGRKFSSQTERFLRLPATPKPSAQTSNRYQSRGDSSSSGSASGSSARSLSPARPSNPDTPGSNTSGESSEVEVHCKRASLRHNPAPRLSLVVNPVPVIWPLAGGPGETSFMAVSSVGEAASSSEDICRICHQGEAFRPLVGRTGSLMPTAARRMCCLRCLPARKTGKAPPAASSSTQPQPPHHDTNLSSVMDELIAPCDCKGSLGLVHRSCLRNWVQLSGRYYCEICRFHFITEQRWPSLKDWFRAVMLRRLAKEVFASVLLAGYTAAGLALCLQASRGGALRPSLAGFLGLLQVGLLLVWLGWVVAGACQSFRHYRDVRRRTTITDQLPHQPSAPRDPTRLGGDRSRRQQPPHSGHQRGSSRMRPGQVYTEGCHSTAASVQRDWLRRASGNWLISKQRWTSCSTMGSGPVSVGQLEEADVGPSEAEMAGWTGGLDPAELEAVCNSRKPSLAVIVEVQPDELATAFSSTSHV